jgi:hypothetical protein
VSTVADYLGRTVDVLAFRGVFPAARGRDQLLAQELVRPGDGGALIAGIEKLAQRALLILLTKAGSRKYAPGEGTQFMADAESGRWRTTADVTSSFYAARLDVSRQCREVEKTDRPGRRAVGLAGAGRRRPGRGQGHDPHGPDVGGRDVVQVPDPDHGPDPLGRSRHDDRTSGRSPSSTRPRSRPSSPRPCSG